MGFLEVSRSRAVAGTASVVIVSPVEIQGTA